MCLLHVVVEFEDKQTGRPLQVAVDANGKPQVDEKGMAQLDVGGPGPRLQVDAFGTGFLAGVDGTLLTNHHVAEPWWHDDELKRLLDQGVNPLVLYYEAYFPGRAAAIRAKLGRISSEADVATLKLETPAPPDAEPLELDARSEASVTGEPVVLMGYPTGVEGILARGEFGCFIENCRGSAGFQPDYVSDCLTTTHPTDHHTRAYRRRAPGQDRL